MTQYVDHELDLSSTTTIQVIVAACDLQGKITSGDIFNNIYSTLDQARAVGETKRARGVLVIVIPTYSWEV